MNIVKQKWNHDVLNVDSAWKGLENYLPSIIEKFNISTNIALEFGVDKGYSSFILSKIFNNVIGVDSFEGDIHIAHYQGEEFYKKIEKTFHNTNVKIIKSYFEEYIKNNNNRYDLIHVDIVHLYEATYKCAEWAVNHSNVVLLHDTESFFEVRKVCEDIAKKYNIGFYNIPEHYGLGILYN